MAMVPTDRDYEYVLDFVTVAKTDEVLAATKANNNQCRRKLAYYINSD